MIKLKETDWDHPAGATDIDYEYPDQPIVDFMNWLRKTSAWHENPELVERRVRKLNNQLMDIRNDRAVEANRAKVLQGLQTKEADAKAARLEQNKASLAKARAAKAAKKVAAGV